MRTDVRDHHAMIFLPPDVAAGVEAARREWDPVMAAQIAAHVTLVYPREAPVVDLLVERLRLAAATTPPFRLRFGTLGDAAHPDDGAYLHVDDVDGGYAAIRQRVLQPPFQVATFVPHVTLVHPRTSARSPEFWMVAGGRYQTGEFTARDIALTAFDGTRWIVLEQLALGHPGALPRIEQWRELPANTLDALVAESERAGLGLVRRLVDEWASGANRFDRPGEAFFAAMLDGRVIGVCGLNVDPYAGGPGIGRVRHLYVLTAHRRGGVGQRLVEAVVEAAGDRFGELRLRTHNPAAERLYERLGFARCTDANASSHRRRLPSASR
jgi:RimJ/RimL family protein N-acetyltransferase